MCYPGFQKNECYRLDKESKGKKGQMAQAGQRGRGAKYKPDILKCNYKPGEMSSLIGRTSSGTTDEPRARQSGELRGETMPRDAAEWPQPCSPHHTGRPSTSCFHGDKNCDTADILNLKKIPLGYILTFFFNDELLLLSPRISQAGGEMNLVGQKKNLCGCEFE